MIVFCELVRVINKNVITFLEIKDMPKRTIMLTHDELTNKVTLNAATIFGFDKLQNLHKEIPKIDNPFAVETKKKFSVTGIYKADIDRGFRALYVYCNIYAPQIVGDVYALLFRTFAIKGKRHDHTKMTYNQPLYSYCNPRYLKSKKI